MFNFRSRNEPYQVIPSLYDFASASILISSKAGLVQLMAPSLSTSLRTTPCEASGFQHLAAGSAIHLASGQGKPRSSPTIGLSLRAMAHGVLTWTAEKRVEANEDSATRGVVRMSANLSSIHRRRN
jgi:hypothetical protein